MLGGSWSHSLLRVRRRWPRLWRRCRLTSSNSSKGVVVAAVVVAPAAAAAVPVPAPRLGVVAAATTTAVVINACSTATEVALLPGAAHPSPGKKRWEVVMGFGMG